MIRDAVAVRDRERGCNPRPTRADLSASVFDAGRVGERSFAGVEVAARASSARQIVACLKGIYGNSWGPRLEYILTNALRLLLDNQGQRNAAGETLLGLPRLLVDTRYRDALLRNCTDPWVVRYWDQEYSQYEKRFLQDAISPIQNKIGQVLMPPAIRHLLGQPTTTIDLSDIMNAGKVLIVNLAKGRLGEEPAHLLGSLLISAFAQAAERRTNVGESARRDFTLYVDEFQNFATDSFATILSEARKSAFVARARPPIHLADPRVDSGRRLGKPTASLVGFRVSDKDARIIAPELGIPNHLTLTDTIDHRAWIKGDQKRRAVEPDAH